MIQKTAAIYFLTLFAFAGSGCGNRKGEERPVTILKGSIEIPASDKIYFYSYADTFDMYLDHKSPLDSAAVSKDGSYSLSPHLKSAYPFDLKCGNTFPATNLILLPGNEITINFHGKENKPEIFPAGKEEMFNNFLIKLSNDFYKDPEARQHYYITSNYLDPEQFDKYISKRKQEQLSLFYSTFQNDSLVKEFRDYALNTINYGIAVDRLMYLWKKRMKGETISVDSSFFDFTSPAFVENRDALNCPAYTRFLYLYVKDIYERMVENGELAPEKGGRLDPRAEKYKLTEKLLSRPFSDVVFCNLILNDKDLVNKKNIDGVSIDSLRILFQKKYSL